MFHELRIYRSMPGRLAALNKRFETITLKLWEKHGIRQVGFWTVEIGETNNDLYYMLEWQSLAEREQRSTAFMTDPDRIAERAETEKERRIGQYLRSSVREPATHQQLNAIEQPH